MIPPLRMLRRLLVSVAGSLLLITHAPAPALGDDPAGPAPKTDESPALIRALSALRSMTSFLPQDMNAKLGLNLVYEGSSQSLDGTVRTRRYIRWRDRGQDLGPYDSVGGSSNVTYNMDWGSERTIVMHIELDANVACLHESDVRKIFGEPSSVGTITVGGGRDYGYKLEGGTSLGFAIRAGECADGIFLRTKLPGDGGPPPEPLATEDEEFDLHRPVATILKQLSAEGFDCSSYVYFTSCQKEKTGDRYSTRKEIAMNVDRNSVILYISHIYPIIGLQKLH